MEEIKTYYVIKKIDNKSNFPYVQEIGNNSPKAFISSIIQAKSFTLSQVISFFDYNSKDEFKIEKVIIKKQPVKEIKIDLIFEENKRKINESSSK